MEQGFQPHFRSQMAVLFALLLQWTGRQEEQADWGKTKIKL